MEVIRVPTFGEGGGDGEEGAAPAADAGKLECGGLHRYIAMAMLCAECLLCTFRLLGAGRAVSILVISHAVGKHPEKKMFGFLGLGAIVFDVIIAVLKVLGCIVYVLEIIFNCFFWPVWMVSPIWLTVSYNAHEILIVLLRLIPSMMLLAALVFCVFLKAPGHTKTSKMAGMVASGLVLIELVMYIGQTFELALMWVWIVVCLILSYVGWMIPFGYFALPFLAFFGFWIFLIFQISFYVGGMLFVVLEALFFVFLFGGNKFGECTGACPKPDSQVAPAE